MEGLIAKLGWKRLAAILIVLSIVFLILIISSFLGAGVTEQKEQREKVTIPTQVPAGRSKTSPQVLNKSFDGQKYKISYPDTWSPQVLPVLGGGALTHFSPAAKSGEAFPRVDIQTTQIASTSPTIEQLVGNLSVLGLARDQVSFHGQTATRLNGVLPFEFKVSNSNLTKKVNKTFLFFELNNTRYIIDYAYYEDENKEESLNLINRVLATYQFQ